MAWIFWKGKMVYKEPSESMLRISIANNLRIYRLLLFIWAGFLFYYALSRDISLLIITIFLSIFVVNYNIAQKIDKARLELLYIKDKLDIIGGKNV